MSRVPCADSTNERSGPSPASGDRTGASPPPTWNSKGGKVDCPSRCRRRPSQSPAPSESIHPPSSVLERKVRGGECILRVARRVPRNQETAPRRQVRVRRECRSRLAIREGPAGEVKELRRLTRDLDELVIAGGVRVDSCQDHGSPGTGRKEDGRRRRKRGEGRRTLRPEGRRQEQDGREGGCGEPSSGRAHGARTPPGSISGWRARTLRLSGRQAKSSL